MSNSDTIHLGRGAYISPHEGSGGMYCADCKVSNDEVVTNPVDAPVHCVECEALLPLELTAAGFRYVENSILQYIESGHGRPEVLRAWAEQYPEAITTGIVDRIREEMSRGQVEDLIHGALEL